MSTQQPSRYIPGFRLLVNLLALSACILSGRCHSVYFDAVTDAVSCTKKCGLAPLYPTIGCRVQGPHTSSNGSCACMCAKCYNDAPPCPGFERSDCAELDGAQPNPDDTWQCCRPCKRMARSNDTGKGIDLTTDNVEEPEIAGEAEQPCALANCPADSLCVEYEKVSVASGRSCCPRCILRLESRPEVAHKCWMFSCSPVLGCMRYTAASGDECCPHCIREKTNPPEVDPYDVCANVRCPVGRICQRRDVGRVHPLPVCSCKPRCKSRKQKQVCGSDGKTYFNQCELFRQSCVSGLSVFIQYPGPCADDTPVGQGANATGVANPTIVTERR